MIDPKHILSGFQTPESRWARFGPYYAMFPVEFAFDVIMKYSKEGDYIIDPFAGRCSSVYAGGVLKRHSLGIEINPIGWLYGSVKLNPADKQNVINRLFEIDSKKEEYGDIAEQMPVFFHMCYCRDVLKFLLAARENLNWKEEQTDATLMSILLVFLHGKRNESLSNQMQITKAMGINYSVEWWKKQKLTVAPEINPSEFILKKIKWRYMKGKPITYESSVLLGDSTKELKKLIKNQKKDSPKFSLLFTSPPYYSVTDYYTDQWLRYWLLGGPAGPKATPGKYKGRFKHKEEYYNLLDIVFKDSSALMKDDSTIYVRTDKRKFTFESTLEILKMHFPNHRIQITDQPFRKKTQTQLYGNRSNEKGEIDIIMTKK